MKPHSQKTLDDHQVNDSYMLLLGKVELPRSLPMRRRYVWAIPLDIHYKTGCLYVTQHDTMITAQSRLYKISKEQQPLARHHLEHGFYFDAVHYFYQSRRKNLDKMMANSDRMGQMIFTVDDDNHLSNKKKKIGIIGAGAAGLFTAYLLEQCGFTNYEILEANNRIGGRIQTVFFNNYNNNSSSTTTPYQELGAMRIPHTFKHKDKILPLKDQAVIFQLVEELNQFNDNQRRRQEYQIEFVPWKQSTDKLENGQVPTKGDIKKKFNSNIPPGDPLNLAYEINNVTNHFLNNEWMNAMATDLYETYMNTYIYISNLNATEYYLGSSRYPEIWTNMYDVFFHEKTFEWCTIRGGMSRFPNAFLPMLGNKIRYNTKVSKIEFIQQQENKNGNNAVGKEKLNEMVVSVQWKDHPLDQFYQHEFFENVIISVPFILLRTWHLPQELPYTLKRAIQNLEHGDSCKVILEFKTPFWQYYEKPILGGCDSTDLFVGLVCYPTIITSSSNVDDKKQQEEPGLLIASYANDKRTRTSFMSEEEHIGRVLEDIQELHGHTIVQEQYTGRYARKCWNLDSFAGAAWADPSAGQRQLFISSYLKDYTQGLVFIGEHTDIKQSWISSALHSAIRGVTMILVEYGYIVEAKQLIHHWNATHWLKI
ncbi:hypothetical protein INT45_014057 [Circinella minor]|uniref:Amine oxidase domain-containing protein n=1 Tax=Circinella minor TaxID=1195481 RepID=A0A8H7VIY3_9FUNG|nr:hypothetical protein INT45_014057 [Circinella minor]